MNMNIRKRKTTLLRTCAAFLILGLHAPLHAAAIVIISSSITVEGKAGANTYSGTNSGSTAGTTADGSNWIASSSGFITTTGATVNAASDWLGGPGNSWITAGYSQVSLTSAFRPLTPNITFKFTGSTGYHAFESWINYTLTDLTALSNVDTRVWAYDFGWTQHALPYTASLMLNVNHQYQLHLLARSAIGDFRQGYANLNLQIVPEPTPAALFSFTLAGMIFRRSRRPA